MSMDYRIPDPNKEIIENQKRSLFELEVQF